MMDGEQEARFKRFLLRSQHLDPSPRLELEIVRAKLRRLESVERVLCAALVAVSLGLLYWAVS